MEWQEADELGDSDDDDSDDDTMMPSSSSLKVVSFVCLKVFHKNLLHFFSFLPFCYAHFMSKYCCIAD